MNPVRRLFRQGSIYTVGTAAQLSAAAVVLPIVTRLLGPSEYGVVALTLSLNVVIVALVGLGVPAAITREYFADDRPDEARGRALVLSTGLLALAGAGVVLASLPVWGPAVADGENLALVIGIGMAIPAATAAAASSLLLVQERPAAFTLVVLISSLGAQLLGTCGLLVLGREAVFYLAGFFAGVALAALVGLGVAGALRSRPASRQVLSGALALGLPTVPHSIALYVLALGDRIVIQAISGSSAVGRYQVAYALGGLGTVLLSALQRAWVPITFSAESQDRWPNLARMATLVVRLGALVAAGLVAVAPLGLAFLAPQSYEPADLVPVVALVAAAAIPWAIYLPMTQVLFWERRTGSLAWITPVSAILNLILVLVLIPPLGLEGAAAATLAAVIVQAGLCALAANRVAGVPWQWGSMLRTGGAGLAAVGVVAAMPLDPAWGVCRALVLGFTIAASVRLVRGELLAAEETLIGTRGAALD